MPETSPYTSVVLEGLSFIDGLENTSGIQEDAYLIPLDYIATLQVPTPGTTPESLIEITTAHILKTGKSLKLKAHWQEKLAASWGSPEPL